jgi:hypothetical protein
VGSDRLNAVHRRAARCTCPWDVGSRQTSLAGHPEGRSAPSSIKNYSLTIRSMPVATNGAFSGTAAVRNFPFKGRATVVVQGKPTRAAAHGTATVPNDLCGSDSPTPKQQLYLETFAAAPSS